MRLDRRLAGLVALSTLLSLFGAEAQAHKDRPAARRSKTVRKQLPKSAQPAGLFSGDEMLVANKTSHSRGAVGKLAVTPRVVLENLRKGESVLDFGAGKDAMQEPAGYGPPRNRLRIRQQHRARPA
jgi:hypothetical protein